ncbi:MAG TPA: cation diffusion facilitator family transporter [Pyrinomonadaceae bacterium]|jgi:cation diffusion facilitator family transporter|nr:cation diffusion facilitator family transporter [Pyrinomonadaceae bacterium]
MWAVIGALVANGLITVFKGIGFVVTGSASMGAEALHSLADTTNQVFLLLGLRFYKRPATEKHPFGYGMERFFWSFIAAIFIFGVGATYAIYEGVEKLRHHEEPTNLKWAYIILGVSFLLEAASIGVAIWQEVREAHHEGMTFTEYLRESKDPTVKTVLFEDSAALLGIVIAAVGIYLTEHHTGPGNGAYWDGMASITIGVVLAIVAFVLARMSRGLLLGEAATPRTVERIRKAILEHPNVVQVVELLTMHLAPKQILMCAHINLCDELATDDVEQTITEIEELIKRAEPKVHMIFLETARESQSEFQEPLAEHMG